jgi:integrase
MPNEVRMPKYSNVRRLPSGRFQGRYKDHQGQTRARTFDTAEQASAWVSGQRADLTVGEWVNPDLGGTLYYDWYTEWTASLLNVRRSTLAKVAAYSSVHVLPAFGDLPMAAISTGRLQEWVNGLAEIKAPATVRGIFQVLNRSLGAAASRRMIRVNPCAGVTLPKVQREEMRFLTVAEIHKLADCMAERYKALIWLGCFGGLRIGEIAALDRRHIDLTRRTLRVERNAVEVRGDLVITAPKTERSRRTVPLPRFIVATLSEHLDTFTGRDATDPVFAGAHGGRLRANNFRRREWAPAVTKAGLHGLRIHDMRHTACALWIETGEPALHVSQLAGHSNIAFTLSRYGHLFDGGAERLTDKLDAMVAPTRSAQVIPLHRG